MVNEAQNPASGAIPDLAGLSPRKALATFSEWLVRQQLAGLPVGPLNRLAEHARFSLNEVVLNENNPDALVVAQKHSAECMAQFTEAWNARAGNGQ